MKTKRFLLVFIIALLSTASARAIVVTVNSVQYDVTGITDTAENIFPTLQSQVWWNNLDLAKIFSDEVTDKLGYPNSIYESEGPFFLYNREPHQLSATAYFSTWSATSPFQLLGENAGRTTYTFATASRVVSTPDAGLTVGLLIAALSGLVCLRRRIA